MVAVNGVGFQLLVMLGLTLSTTAQFQCENSACVQTISCNTQPLNTTQWVLVNKTIDGLTAINVILTGLQGKPLSNVNCPNIGQSCHMWGAGYSDRNGVFLINGSTTESFRIESWPATPSLPVGPIQTPPGQCLSHLAGSGSLVAMAKCSDDSLRFRFDANGQLAVQTAVPVTDPLCLGVIPPAPPAPPSRPNHYFSCTTNLAGGPRLSFPFCNASLPLDERLDDLISRATCQEKSEVMTSTGSSIPRLGVPSLGSAEDTHGVGVNCIPQANLPSTGYNGTGCGTTFPAGPGLGASFDRELWTAIGGVIGTEARGLNNMKASPLYFLDPDINLLRDPRWGRAQEVPGEDPYLTGEYGTYIIRATQYGDIDQRYMQAASTMKHFQVYDYEGYQPNHNSDNIPPDAKCDGNGQNCGRSTFDAFPPQRDFAGYYMGAFKTVAQRAAPAAIMCAYNAIYGIPACASPINNEVARDGWGWDGFVISDCGAVQGIQGAHEYTHDSNATIAAALNQGGVDVNCGGAPEYYAQHLCDALTNGSIAQSDVDRGVRRLFKTMFKLGMFDPMEAQPLITDIGVHNVDSAANRALARKSAEEGMVLLKNLKFMPLDGKNGRKAAAKTKFAFIGPHFNSTQDLLSAPQYHGQNILVNTHSPLQVAQRRGWQVTYAKGCNICDWVPQGYPNQPCSHGPDGKNGPNPPPDTTHIANAVATATAADVAVLFLGADQTTEAENFDRVDLGLAGAQEQLLSAVLAVQPNTIVVLINGGPIDVESAANSPNVKAIIEAFQPGELGADAILDLIEGLYSPSGLMPYTTYFRNYTKRDIREVDLTAGSGTTYWWHTDPVLFPFGYGLSYTTFSFNWTPTPPIISLSNNSNADISDGERHTSDGDDHDHDHDHDYGDNGGSIRVEANDVGDLRIVLSNHSSKVSKSDFTLNHSVTVTNTGSTVSDVVVLAFVVATSESAIDTPLKKLFGFQRFTSVKPGESRTAYFSSTATTFGVVGEDGVRRLIPGRYRIECSGSGSGSGDGGSGRDAREIHVVGDTAAVIEPNIWPIEM